MKRCPTCNQTYADDSMSFCLSDGAPLVRDTGGEYPSQPTLVYTGQSSSDTSPQGRASTNPNYAGRPAQNWTEQSAQQFAGQPQKKRSLLPWILGGVFLLLLGAAGLVVVLAIVMVSSSSNRNRSTSNASVPGNSNRSNRNGYSNSNNSNNTGYSARKGRYTGTGANTTKSPASTGDAEVEITEINDTTGALKMDIKFSNGLCGEGKSYGVINKTTGEISSFGSLKSEGGDCPSTTWVIITKCSFSGSDTLKCTYRLTAVGETPQDGNFEVTQE